MTISRKTQYTVLTESKYNIILIFSSRWLILDHQPKPAMNLAGSNLQGLLWLWRNRASSTKALSSSCTEAKLQVALTTLAGGLIVAIFIQWWRKLGCTRA